MGEQRIRKGQLKLILARPNEFIDLIIEFCVDLQIL